MRDQVVARIDRLDEGKTFSAKELLDIASRTTTGSYGEYLIELKLTNDAPRAVDVAVIIKFSS